jgi:cobalt/nickel transport system permease protein
MQVDFLDRFSRGKSIVHRLDARWKLLIALVLVACVLATPWQIGPLYLWEAGIVLCFYAVSGLPWRYLIVRLAAMLPFLLLLAAAYPLSLGLEAGWVLAARLLVRSLVSLATMITLVATTPFHRLLVALAQLGVPQMLLSILAFMYRYMFVLADELEKMRRAKLARTFYPSVWNEVRLMGTFVGMLFVRAFERAERVYAAMLARGWTGKMPAEDDRL